MEAKIKIDLGGGILEVEGSEKFVSDIYDDFKKNLDLNGKGGNEWNPTKKRDNAKKVQSKKKKVVTTHRMPVLVKDLDLLGRGKGIGLKEFVGKYQPFKTYMDWNVIFVYYLQKILEIKEISIDHVYTCYKHINQKTPKRIYQSLVDTSHNRGTIITASIDDIKISIAGENFVEHDALQKDDIDKSKNES